MDKDTLIIMAVLLPILLLAALAGAHQGLKERAEVEAFWERFDFLFRRSRSSTSGSVQLQDVGSSMSSSSISSVSESTGKAELNELKKQNAEMQQRIAHLEKNVETPVAMGTVIDQQPKV